MGAAKAPPTGLAGLRYPITQISLAVNDLDKTMALYHRAFGWAPWQVFDHKPPVHHNTQVRGKRVHYALRGAEVYVGSMNFELLEPTDGPNLWTEFIERRGEGIASIATMFHERADGDAVKAAFKEHYGVDVIMKADIGDHIEYYYLDTQERFGCLIESGSGHAIDFIKPNQIYPRPDAELGPSPMSGLTYRISQVSVVVHDLNAKLRTYHEAFGWAPWRVFGSGHTSIHHCEMKCEKVPDFQLRWAEVMVGDINFELIQPLGGLSPWQQMLDTKGEGIGSIAVMFRSNEESERVKAQFSQLGIGIAARGHIGDRIEWFHLETEPTFKCVIKSANGRALDDVEPDTVYP
jgi:methylmalonyl-CoA/ethylmalonyl-CoA epimerase